MIAPESIQAAVIKITRKEGDTCSVVITVPEIIELSTFSEIKFHIFEYGEMIVEKNLSDDDGSIYVDSQDIIVMLNKDDLVGHSGTCYYECELSGNPDEDVLTILEGEFEITKQYIV